MAHRLPRLGAMRQESPAFFDAQRPRVEALLIRQLGPRQDLEDLVQIVFLELLRALPKFRRQSSVSTFLGGITLMVARRCQRPTAWDRRRSTMPLEAEDPGPSLDRLTFAREQVRRTRAALDRLSPKKREALIARCVRGQSAVQIAAETGVSLSATRARIYHGRRELEAHARADPYLEELVER